MSSPELWEARGKCVGPLTDDAGADRQKDGRYAISSSLALASGAEHLGLCYTCPMADIETSKEMVFAVIREYQSVKRLGIRADPTIPISYLIAIDDEIERMRARNQMRAKALEEARKR